MKPSSAVRTTVLVLLAVVSLFSFSGCKNDPPWKSQTYTDVTVRPQAGEVKIPASLWTKILALASSGEADGKHESATPETALESLKVYLIEKNKGVLNGHNTALSFVAGGGELNLADYRAPLRGSYFIAFEFMPEAPAAETKVFFLSNSVIRKAANGDQIGSGCHTYFELTKRFAKAMKQNGFLVNTSDQRDVSALAGTYVFARVIDGKLHLATLIIKDEDHRALQCRH
jgi:hypothetical protein